MEGHSLPHPEQPDWVRLNVQEWVAPHLKEAYGEALGPRDRRPRDAAAGRPARQPPQGHGRAGARRAGARGHRDRADALRAATACACKQAAVGRDGRGLPERPGRDPGRGLAARGRAGRCPARHADRRLLRRRRRQDAGDGGRHEQQGPRRGDGRARDRGSTARPSGCAAPARTMSSAARSTPTAANG